MGFHISGRVAIEMRTPVLNESPTGIASVLTKLYVAIVTDALDEYSFGADLASLVSCIIVNARELESRRAHPHLQIQNEMVLPRHT